MGDNKDVDGDGGGNNNKNGEGGGRRAKPKKPMVDSSTEEQAQRVFVLQDSGALTYNAQAFPNNATPTHLRRLVASFPWSIFKPNARTMRDIRDGDENRPWRAYMEAIKVLYQKICLFKYGSAENAALIEASQVQTAKDVFFYWELGADAESKTSLDLSKQLDEFTRQENKNDPAAQDMANELRRSQRLRNSTPRSWRLHILYNETHPIEYYAWKERSARMFLDDPSVIHVKREGDEAAQAYDAETPIGQSILTKAWTAMIAEITLKAALRHEETTASGSRPINPVLARKNAERDFKDDPIIYLKSARDVLFMLHKCVPNMDFSRVPETEYIMDNQEDPANEWSLARLLSVDRAIAVEGKQTSPEQTRPNEYKNGQFPMPERVWHLYSSEVKRYQQALWPNVEEPRTFGNEHTALLNAVRGYSLCAQANFVAKWAWQKKKKGTTPKLDEYSLSLAIRAGYQPERKQASPPEAVHFEEDDRPTAAELVEWDTTLELAARDTARRTRYFTPEPTPELTWAILADKYRAESDRIDTMCAKWRTDPRVDPDQLAEFEQNLRQQLRIDTQHALQKFKNDSESNEKMSTTDKHFAKFGRDFLAQHKSFYALNQEKVYNDVSSFAEMVNFLTFIWKTIYQCNRNIPVLMQIFISILHQHLKCKANPHVLLIGDQAAGKSYLLSIIQDSLIPFTLVDLANMSEKAQHVEGDISGKAYLCQELDPAITSSNGKAGSAHAAVVSNKSNKGAGMSTSTTEALWKNKLTSNEIYVECFDRDKDGKRVCLIIRVLANCTYVFCSNYEGTESIKPAFLSRFIVIELPPSTHSDKAPISNVARQAKDFNLWERKQLEKLRLLQYLVWDIKKSINTGNIKLPDLSAAENFVVQILERASSMGAYDTHDVRKVGHVMMNLTSFSVATAAFEEYLLNPRKPAGMHDPSHALNVTPRLVVTMEMMNYALGLHAAQFSDPAQRHLMHAVQKMWAPDPIKNILYRKMESQVEDNTKPYWQKYLKATRRLVGAIESKQQAVAVGSVLSPANDAIAPAIHAALGNGGVLNEDEKVLAFRVRMEELKEAGYIVKLKGKPTSKEPDTYFVVDPDRLAIPLTFDPETLFRDIEDSSMKIRFSKSVIRTTYNRAIQTLIARTVNLDENSHMSVFQHEARKTVYALQLPETPIAHDATGQMSRVLTIASSFLMDRVMNPIAFASAYVLSHAFTPQRLMIRCEMIHPHSSQFSYMVVPRNPANRLKQHHRNERSALDDQLLRRYGGRELYCEVEGGVCADANCKCKMWTFEPQKVIRGSLIVDYDRDPDEVSYATRVENIGWSTQMLAEAKLTGRLTPAEQLVYWKPRASDLLSYREVIDAERVHMHHTNPIVSDTQLDPTAAIVPPSRKKSIVDPQQPQSSAVRPAKRLRTANSNLSEIHAPVVQPGRRAKITTVDVKHSVPPPTKNPNKRPTPPPPSNDDDQENIAPEMEPLESYAELDEALELEKQQRFRNARSALA